jgi:hypothetical protein
MSTFPFMFPAPLLFQAALLFVDISVKAFAGITLSLVITEAFLSWESL